MIPEQRQLTLKIDTDSQAYLDSLIKDTLFADLIYLRDENSLCGSFDKHYGLFFIKDHSGRSDLKSIVTQLTEYKNNQYSSKFNFPYISGVREFIDSILKEDYITNFKSVKRPQMGDLINFTDIPKLPDWVDLSTWEETKCSPSQLNNIQLIQVIQYIENLPNSNEIMEEYHKMVENSYNNFLSEVNSTISLERPIQVSLYGNDDTSYGKTVSSIQEALFIYNALLQRADKQDIYSIVEELNLSFTN